MKKVLLMFMGIALILCFSLSGLQAQETPGGKKPAAETGRTPVVKKGTLGAGVMLGSPMGPNVKYWFTHDIAVDVGLGFAKDFSLYSDVLWHRWTLFPQPPKGVLAGYLGLGLRYENEDDDDEHDEFGIRTVAGASYWVPSNPIEVVVEIAPVFQVSPDTDTGFDAGIGVRYYFTGL